MRPKDPNPDTGLATSWEATEESDIAAALVRTAFIIAFTLTPFVLSRPSVANPFAQIMVWVAALFNLALFGSYLIRRRLPLKRHLALLVDLFLVSSAISSFEGFPQQRDWLVPIYYLLIMVAAIWFRRIGAIAVAFVASVMYGVFVLHLSGWSVLWHGHTPVLLLVAVIASHIVMARDRERAHSSRLEHEMLLARRLQDALFPEALPRVAGVDIGVRFVPARTVGGDLYDALALDDGRLLVCVGDMPGNSVYGLVHLSLVHSHMRAASLRGLGPAGIAELVNQGVYDALQPDSYAPLFIAAIDPVRRCITFANCGHLPPVLIRAGDCNQTEELATGDIVIGAVREPHYTERSVPVGPGDVLVCYTDGVVEARGRKGETFGTERLVAAASGAHGGAQEIAARVMEESIQFRWGPDDDRTVLVVKII